MGKYLQLLDRAVLERRRDKSDQSDKSPPLDNQDPDFGRLYRFGRSPEPDGSSDSWTDAEEERAAIIEYDGGAPRAWAEALARLDPSKPPRGVRPERWLRFIDDCGHFLDRGWAAQAMALGWGPLELFGCYRKRPYHVPHRGLRWEVNGGKIVALDCDRAIIEIASGDRWSYKRQPLEVGRVVVLAWELSDNLD
jgi:hypothetical protein